MRQHNDNEGASDTGIGNNPAHAQVEDDANRRGLLVGDTRVKLVGARCRGRRVFTELRGNDPTSEAARQTSDLSVREVLAIARQS